MSQPLEVTDPALDAKEEAEWAKAAEHQLRGGDPDGESAEEAGSETEVREFRYRGKTVKVDAGTYEILEDLRREARSGNGRVGSELARTRERLARMEAQLAARDARPVEEPELTPPDPMLATTDIKAWQREYTDYQDRLRKREIAALRAEYENEQRQQATRQEETARAQEWASQFYSNYDHLDSPEIKVIVAQEYKAHEAELKGYGDDVDGAHERLAELAEARLRRIRQAGKSVSDPTNDNRKPLPRIESSSGPLPRRTEQPDESRRSFSAASWVARQREKMQGREPRKER